ncbi:MAG: hypothetical protein JW795_05905 [Chitinivibrionales bacterium]|nr:hypothetical protein [Chitinivibrionales bacterium]
MKSFSRCTQRVMHLCIRTTYNEQGSVLLYVLATLIVVSTVSVAILQLSSHDFNASKDYVSISTAKISSIAALQACETFFRDRSQETVTILNSFIDESNTNPNKVWLIGSEQQPVVLKNQQKYAARIINLDRDNFYIMVEGIGYGKSGSKRSATGVYYLGGLALQRAVDSAKIPLLYFDDNANTRFTNARVEVKGMFVTKTRLDIQSSATNSIFYGPFITSVRNNVSIRFQGNHTFHEKVFFGIPVNFESAGGNNILFNNIAGFQNILNFNACNLTCNKDLYVNETVTAGNVLDMKSNTFHYNQQRFNQPNAAWLINEKTPSDNRNGTIDVRLEMGLTTALARPVFQIPQEAINAYAWKWSKFGTGTNSEKYYVGRKKECLDNHMANLLYKDAVDSNRLWNGYALVHVDVKMALAIYSTYPNENFNGKIVYILDALAQTESGYVEGVYNSSETAFTIWYVRNGGDLHCWGGWPERFRGYIYIENGGVVQMGGNGLSVDKRQWDGAFHNCGTAPNGRDYLWDNISLDPISYATEIGELIKNGMLIYDGALTVNRNVIELTQEFIVPEAKGVSY